MTSGAKKQTFYASFGRRFSVRWKRQTIDRSVETGRHPRPECRSDGDGMVPALFECEDDEVSGESVSPSNSADRAMVYEMTQED